MSKKNINKLIGEVAIPGDKSISHRAIMFGSISKGITEIDNFLTGADCLSTIGCFREMGVEISLDKNKVVVRGNGLHGLKEPAKTLDCGNSGTTTRLISGILAGQSFGSRLIGDESIQKRPMKRIMDPLTLMGAKIKSEKDNNCAPLLISPSNLHGISYNSPVASAQVKSSILLAGLYADGITKVIEPKLSRNHTELMLNYFGANITSEDKTATVIPGNDLLGQKVMVPGDISSAAYFLVAASIVPDSEVLIKNVGINDTRDGIIRVLKDMGADITYVKTDNSGAEPIADILVKYAPLHGVEISGDIIPTLIDEIPVIAIAACFASGTTTIKDAAELKVKESDRIAVMSENLTAIGADVTPTDDGMIINGGKELHGANIKTYKDHRIAMSFKVAEMAMNECINLDYPDCVTISYPCFYDDLESLINK